MGLHPTASSSKMQPEENNVSKSSDELQSTKSTLYLLKYVLEMFNFSRIKNKTNRNRKSNDKYIYRRPELSNY